MTSLIKNQILKHLTKFFKDLAPEQLQLSAFKGSCELSDLRLEENVLMDLLSFPAWIRINKATCDQLSIKIPWTKIKSVPIQMNLNEVMVEVEVCDEFRDISSEADELNLSNLINAQAPGKYGFVDRVIDGITVTVNNVLITFKSKLMTATFNLSRVIMESRCPNWKPGELSLTKIKDVNRGQILLFKIVEWQTMRLEAKCLTDPLQAPLRLITNHAQCRLTIKKKLDDCSVIAARIFVIFDDILWVLTFAQFTSAASFVEYIFTLIKRSPMSKKSGILDDQSSSATNTSSSNNSTSTSSYGVSQSSTLISPLNTSINSASEKPCILTGNLSSASLLEQKFLCYDLRETSMHLYIDKIDAHLYDDIEISPSGTSNRDSGGALQTTFDQIQVDCYPYSHANNDRKHWYKWFDPSPNSRKQWVRSHFAEFDLMRMQKAQELQNEQDGEVETSKTPDLTNDTSSNKPTPIALDGQLLSLTVLVKVKDYCMHCVATKHSTRGACQNKFIQTDKDYHMPAEMPALYLELDYFYYFDAINRMMIYDNVPEPLAFMHLSPTKLLFDSPTLLFLNSFQVNLSKAFVHLNNLFPEETTAPKIHCHIEILMPQISLPAKATKDQPVDVAHTSTLFVKSGKVTLANSIYDKNVLAKLMESIEYLKQGPNQSVNLGGYQTSPTRRENSSTGDWNKVWNANMVDKMAEFSVQNQLWSVQFEPVWMDFLNYDVDELSSGQRLEPIVEPVSAYAFVHLNLSAPQSNSTFFPIVNSSQKSNPGTTAKKRDIISILVTVMDGPILANMDKVQFSFLQRLGMHVEKLLQQIKEDASNVIQIDTIVEDTLELNLTAYIKEIKARLILEKKIERSSINDTSISRDQQHVETSYPPSIETTPCLLSSSVTTPQSQHVKNAFFNTIPNLSETLNEKTQEDRVLGVAYTPENASVSIGCAELSNYDSELLDECTEVADDASCLFLGEPSPPSTSASTTGNPSSGVSSKPAPVADVEKPKPSEISSIEESLLINLDEIEQSSSLFAKMDLKSSKLSPTVGHSEQHSQEQHNQVQQEIETESISYLELSMSKLMREVNMEDSKVKSFGTHVPSLGELVSVLQEGLKSYFAEVNVGLVDCPDFSQSPYKIAVSGLHGKPTIADVGGVQNLIPHVNLESKYDLSTVTKTIYKSDSDYPISIFGPGGGSFSTLGYCCEFMGSANYASENNDVKLVGCACRYAYVDEDGNGQWREQVNDDRFGLMGNFYLSQNKQGKVLKILVKKRTGKLNYTEAIRAVLLSKYGQEKPISMGGVFLINSGSAKLHVMPKHWPKEPSTDESINNEWLKFYNITKHPLVCLSVFHSHDPGYNLRMEHTHCFNLETQSEAGHYHYDVTPDTIEYEGYFNPAERVYRLDYAHKK